MLLTIGRMMTRVSGGGGSIAVSAPLAVTHIPDINTSSKTTRTFNHVTDAATTTLIVLVEWCLYSSTVARTLSGLTVDGNAATIVVQGNNSGSTPNSMVGAAICSITVSPSAVSRAIVPTISASVNRISISVLESSDSFNASPVTASDVATDANTVVDVDISPSAPALIVSAAIGVTSTSGPTATWNAESTEIGESTATATNHSIETTSYEVVSGALTRTVSMTCNNTCSCFALVAAAFQK